MTELFGMPLHRAGLLIRLVVIAGCIFAGYIGILLNNKRLRSVITVVYFGALIYYVCASRVLINAAIAFHDRVYLASGVSSLPLTSPSFWGWGLKKVFASYNYGGRYGFLLNILLFVPFGYIVPSWFKKYHSIILTTLLGFALSYCIENFQRVTGFGTYDVMDMIANTSGAFIGAVAIMPNLWLKVKNN